MSVDPDSVIHCFVNDQEGQVVIGFDRPVRNWVLDPGNAVQIAEAMAKAAWVAHHGKAPPNGVDVLLQRERHQVTEQLRQRLVNRATHVMRSLVEQKFTPGQAATQLVDLFLQELR